MDVEVYTYVHVYMTLMQFMELSKCLTHRKEMYTMQSVLMEGD